MYLHKHIYVSRYCNIKLKCNMEGKHYFSVIKSSAIIKLLLSNMTLNLTSSKCSFTYIKISLKTTEYIRSELVRKFTFC